MLTIIVIGFVLFIVGVGLTFLHDKKADIKAWIDNNKAKNKEKRASKQVPFNGISRLETIDIFNAQLAKARAATAAALDRATKARVVGPIPPKKVVLPGRVKTIFYKAGEPPAEESKPITVEDLIKQIEAIKKGLKK